jgi:hypothetical protein
MSAVTRGKTILIVGALTCFLIGSLYPFESIVVPAWRLRVVDEEGRACPDMLVNQGWKHYSLDLEAGDYGEHKFTDVNGYVDFSKRTIRASLIQRIIAPVIAHALTIAHGSTGKSGYVFATGMKEGAWLDYKPGKSLPDKILVDRCSAPTSNKALQLTAR